jgi:hypothetical protein
MVTLLYFKVPPLKLRKKWYIVSLEQVETSQFNLVEPRFAAKFADQSEFIQKVKVE